MITGCPTVLCCQVFWLVTSVHSIIKMFKHLITQNYHEGSVSILIWCDIRIKKIKDALILFGYRKLPFLYNIRIVLYCYWMIKFVKIERKPHLRELIWSHTYETGLVQEGGYNRPFVYLTATAFEVLGRNWLRFGFLIWIAYKLKPDLFELKYNFKCWK